MVRLLFLVAICVVGPYAWAADGPDARQQALHDAWRAAAKAATQGPATIALLDQGSVAVPVGEAYVPEAQAANLMRAMGNTPDQDGAGMVVPLDGGWFIVVRWVADGYVRDGDATDWQPDALLAGLRSNTEAENTTRVAEGRPPFDIIGWVEPPRYDRANHRLVWSVSAQDRGALSTEPKTINYNTYALGRGGYFSLDLVTSSDRVDANKPVVQALLGTLRFAPGKRYQDFNGSTDTVAKYGLAALIGVVAVKKLGLIALAGVFLLKVWKLGLLALAGGVAVVRRWLRPKPPVS